MPIAHSGSFTTCFPARDAFATTKGCRRSVLATRFCASPEKRINSLATGPGDLVVFVVADNPIGEAHYYPDSKKWSVPIPERRMMRSDARAYFDGEE